VNQEEAYSKIVLFIYLVTLNDRKTIELAVKAAQLFQIQHEDEKSEFDPELTVLEICNDLIQGLSSQALNQPAISNPNFLIWPEHFNFISWREFHKKSGLTERMAIVAHIVLGISINKVAFALSTSEGTIRYRLNKGLSLLGQLNRPNWSVA
jgi:DNA-binding NarL/FixJ family response regulator